MEVHVDRLAQQALADLTSQQPSQRVIIGICGVPGAGKTTLAAAVTQRINALAGKTVAVTLPMDGFHFSRAHLASMPSAAEAIHRRGAAFTFDGEGFLSLIQSLAAPGASDRTTHAPSFAHEVKDPVADAIAIPPDAQIVLIEGNYCALNRRPWSDAAALMSRLWYVDTPSEVTHLRLAKRHLASGIVADEKEAWERARGTDELNAQDIRDNLLNVDEVIKME